MACGRPVICTDLATGTTFINKHNVTGLVVPPQDAKSLAQAINKIITDEDLMRTFGVNGRKRAFLEFTSNKMVQSTYELYTELVKD